jgi:hypothetical protein
MCQAVKCSKCGKPTWAGCGAHVEQVLGHVPKAKRCQGHAREKAPASTGKKKGFLAWLGLA